MTCAETLLAPTPRRLERTGGTWRSGERLSVWVAFSASERDRLIARASEAMESVGLGIDNAADADSADLLLAPGSDLLPQAYRLDATDSGWRIEAGDAAGAFYGLCTLAQWLTLHCATDSSATDRSTMEAPRIHVEDAPSFPTRGAMLDVSRNRVPTMETLFRLVDRLAALKLNHLQLYVEHTFAYEGHEEVWRGWSPLTGEEIQALDAHCKERFVELAPNQNSFGHFHRWLVHDAYRPLAECPEGIEHPFGDEREPFSLCPTDPRSLDLLDDLYGQLLPHFTSSRFNVGLDETFDLGRGRSAAEVERVGKGRVYLEFLKRVHGLVAKHDRRMLFWGDIILEHPELIAELPEDVVALEWGYEADHPFAEHGERFAASGREFWVCPGTSSWLSFAGRATNALGNLESAARNGSKHGASGYLVTDWGDQGHLQPLCASFLGWVAGAGWAWNAESGGRREELPALSHQIERWVIASSRPETLANGGPVGEEPARRLGEAVCELAQIYQLPGPLPMNRSVLFSIVHRIGGPLIGGPFDRLGMEELERTVEAVQEIRGRAAKRVGGTEGLTGPRGKSEVARLSAPEQTAREVVWAADALALACEIGLRRLEHGRERPASTLPAVTRRKLSEKARRLAQDLEPLWLARHRPGGLDATLHWWSRIERALATG